MVRKKYAGEKEIRDKIKELFRYRKLTDLIRKAGLDKDIEFLSALTDVQYQIYLLDAHLESEWDIHADVLKAHWENIVHALRKIVPEPEDIQPLLREIHQYERIELNCRKNKWPTRERFKTFYTIKSCDVRLIRHLIYRERPELQHHWKEKAWTGYDLITEVNDDIADVHEDLRTFNGNRFLISILRKGNRKTEKRYRSKLLSITDTAKKYFDKHAEEGDNKQLLAWTLERSAETMSLLDATLHQDDHAIYASSLILQKMK